MPKDPSKMLEIINSPEFQATIKPKDFQTAKKIVLDGIETSSQFSPGMKASIKKNIEDIEAAGANFDQLHRYLYNSYLAFKPGKGGEDLRVIQELEILKRLLVLANILDQKGLVAEALQLDNLIKEASPIK